MRMLKIRIFYQAWEHCNIIIKFYGNVHIFSSSPSLNYWIDPVTHLVLGRIATAIIQNESVTVLLVFCRHFLLSTNQKSSFSFRAHADWTENFQRGFLLVEICRQKSVIGWESLNISSDDCVLAPENSVEFLFKRFKSVC